MGGRFVGCASFADDARDLLAARGVGGIDVAFAHEGIAHDAQAAGAVIEDEHRLGDHEERLRQAELILRRGADRRLEKAHHVVGEIADGAAGEARLHRACVSAGT